MAVEILPGWMSNLDEEDIALMKRVILSSGSPK